MKFKVLTLFPEMIMNASDLGMIGRAQDNEIIDIECIQIRDYADNNRGQVDDYTYGGGAGMLMRPQVVYDAYKAAAGDGAKKRCIYMSPAGRPFTQQLAQDLSKEDEIIILCGRYEGVDERVLETIVTDRISIGEYVLTGGELAALVVIDAVSRLIPGVLGNDKSSEVESFYRGLLEYPQYTRPEEWHGKSVPEVLLTGDHKSIEGWRLERSKEITERVRPDLYSRYIKREEIVPRLLPAKRDNAAAISSVRFSDGEPVYSDDIFAVISDMSSKEAYLCRIDKNADKAGHDISDHICNKLSADIKTLYIPQNCMDESGIREAWKKEGEYFLMSYTDHSPISRKKITDLSGEERELAEKIYSENKDILADLRIPYIFINTDDGDLADMYESLGYLRSNSVIVKYTRV